MQEPQIKGRLTAKKLMEWINKEFIRLEITDYVVYKIDRTRFRGQDYEAGACSLHVRFHHLKNKNSQGTFLCFYPLHVYDKHLKMGYRLHLTLSKYNNYSNLYSLTDLTVDVVK